METNIEKRYPICNLMDNISNINNEIDELINYKTDTQNIASITNMLESSKAVCKIINEELPILETAITQLIEQRIALEFFIKELENRKEKRTREIAERKHSKLITKCKNVDGIKQLQTIIFSKVI